MARLMVVGLPPFVRMIVIVTVERDVDLMCSEVQCEDWMVRNVWC